MIDVYSSKKVFSVFQPLNVGQTVLKSLGSGFLGLCEDAKLVFEYVQEVLNF